MSAQRPQSSTQVVSVPQEVTGQPRRVVVGRVTWRDTFAALRHRNYRLFFVGQLVSLIGSWMQNTAQGWLVYQLTGSKVLLGTVAAVGSLPMLLLSVWGGSVADRHPKRGVIYCTQIAMMLLAFAFAGLVWSGNIQPWHILVLAALGGAAMAFDMPARQAFMVEITGRDDLMNAVSLNSSIVNGARVVGPAVAGFLMAKAGMTLCFVLNGISYFAVIAGLRMMRLPKFVPPPQPASAGRHILDGFAYVAAHRRLRALFLLFGVVGIFGWSYSVLLPAYATDILHVSESGYGALLSANGLGALLGALTVATFGSRVRPRLLILGGLWTFSAMLLLLAFVRWLPLVLLCLAVGGWGMLLYFATTNTLIQTSVSDAMRGRVMGIWALVFGGMVPIGGLESGVLSQAVGVPWAIAVGAAVCAGAGLVTWWQGRRQPEASVNTRG
ncbi:MAG TPA: MFS transporter [Candidatus Paceibacterota bacterium]|nr:MFS transporter [Candidatus Paceibacterota bacterium]